MKRIKMIKVPEEMLESRIEKIVSCSGPIACIGIQFKNGYRLDIATNTIGPPEKQFQIVSPSDNPYKL